MRIVFAGTPEFALPSLEALLESEHEVAAVYTQPDRPAGRGRQPKPSPVKRRAGEAGVPVRQPQSLRNEAEQASLGALRPGLMVVAAYGLILPQAVLDIPRHGCINVHASLLPRWRGAAPIQRALLAGDERTGITIMQMDAGLDTGDILLQRSDAIDPEDSAADLHDRLAKLGAQALKDALAALERGELAARPQDESQATYAPKLEKREGRLDWSQAARTLARQVRALVPRPGVFAELDGERINIHQAVVSAEHSQAAPGTVVAAGDQGIDVACGEQALRITRLQWPGKKPVTASAAAHGRQLVGRRFG